METAGSRKPGSPSRKRRFRDPGSAWGGLYQQRSYNAAAALYYRRLTLRMTSYGEAGPSSQAAEKRYRLFAWKIGAG